MRRVMLLGALTGLVSVFGCGGGGNAAPGAGAPTGAPTGGGAPTGSATGGANLCAGVTPVGQVVTSCTTTPPVVPGAWTRCFGSLGDDDGNAVAVGPDGSVYLGAGYGGLSSEEVSQVMQCQGLDINTASQIDFGNGMLTSSMGDEDPLVVKLDPNGNVIWVTAAPGMGGEGEVRSLAIGPSGLVIGGDFVGAANFGGTANLTSQGRDLFVAELDPNTGAPLWAITGMITPDPLTGENSADVWGVDEDLMGNVIATGDFQGTLSIGGKTIQAQGKRDMFTMELDATGNVLWLDDAGGPGDDSRGGDVTVEPDGSFVAVGILAGAADEHFTDHLGNDVIVHQYAGAPATTDRWPPREMVMVHYRIDGSVDWATNGGFPGMRTEAEGVTHDSMGNIYVAGQFDTCVLFPMVPSRPNAPTPPPTFSRANPPPCVSTQTDFALASPTMSRDQFVVAYDPNGNFLWAKALGGTETDRAYSIQEFEGPGGPAIYVGGRGRGPIMFDTISVPAPGPRDAHTLAKLDLQGNVMWAKSFGSMTEDSDFYDIAVDPTSGAVVGVGNFGGTGMMMPGGVVVNGTSTDHSNDDIVVWKVNADGSM